MFSRVFGKKVDTQSQSNPIIPIIGNFINVLVKRSAIEKSTDEYWSYNVVQEVVNFVNASFNQGLYTRWELPEKTLQAYHADYYLAQVKNGGHSQFIHNSSSNLAFTISDARAGLKAMGAAEHLAILEKAADWIATNPDEAALQNGFSSRADFLEPLDTAFFAAERTAPMIEKSRQWIMSWPELKLIDDADYPEAMKRMAQMNPAREARLAFQEVSRFAAQMTDRFQVSIGLACSNAAKVEMRLSVGAGSYMSIEGQDQLAFRVQTWEPEPRVCVVADDFTSLYQLIMPNNPQMPDLADKEGWSEAIKDGRLADYKSPKVGTLISRVENKQVLGILELQKEHNAPYAADLAFRKAEVRSGKIYIQPSKIGFNDGEPYINWFVITESGESFILRTLANEAVLYNMKTDTVAAHVHKFEIDAWAKKIESSMMNSLKQ